MMKVAPKIYKMRIVFRWLDNGAEDRNVFNAVRKMVLGSGLPYEPAKVNKSWPRLAYGPSPAKGQRVEREYLDIYLREHRSEDDVRGALQQVAPEGLELLQVSRVPYPLPSVQNLAAAVRYRVKGAFAPLNSSGRKIEDWAGKGKLTVTVRAQNAIAYEHDITPYVLQTETLSPDEVAFTLGADSGQWISPQWVIAAWLGREVPAEEDPFAGEDIIFIRQGFLWKDSQGEFHPI